MEFGGKFVFAFLACLDDEAFLALAFVVQALNFLFHFPDFGFQGVGERRAGGKVVQVEGLGVTRNTLYRKLNDNTFDGNDLKILGELLGITFKLIALQEAESTVKVYNPDGEQVKLNPAVLKIAAKNETA